jgi:hypothetical protein
MYRIDYNNECNEMESRIVTVQKTKTKKIIKKVDEARKPNMYNRRDATQRNAARGREGGREQV